jgi:putative transposase
MRYNPAIHHRRSIRLKGYDYTRAGAYFITICTQDRACLFGDIAGGEMRLNGMGRIVDDTWRWLGKQYDYVEIAEYVVMPNHLHGIIVMGDNGDDGDGVDGCPGRGGSRTAPTGATPKTAPAPETATHPTDNSETGLPKRRKTVGRLIGAFKTVSTKQINIMRETPGAQIWQRDFYEHIIRNDDEYRRIAAYIINNPGKWDLDKINPLNYKEK